MNIKRLLKVSVLFIGFLVMGCFLFRSAPNGLAAAEYLYQPTAPVQASVEGEEDGEAMLTFANPAAVYCNDLGYEYRNVTTENGDVNGECVLPDESVCDEWSFVSGTCGVTYNYCSQQGLETVIKSDGMNPYSLDYALCVDAEGTEVGQATELMELADKVRSGCGTGGEKLPLDARVMEPGLAEKLAQDVGVPPASFDWRNYNGGNWMTSVKNQAQCGSCWSFSAVGTSEAAWNIAMNNAALDLNLSEQYLVSRCLGNGTCCGGWQSTALDNIYTSGIPDEACMTYVDGTSGYDGTTCSCPATGCSANCTYRTSGYCSDKQCSDRCADYLDRLTFIDDYGYIADDQTIIKQALIDYGPLAVALDMDVTPNGSGVYSCSAEDSVNHAVIIVGYDDAGGYWIIKNSWGGTWGYDTNGYFRLAYGECFVEDYVYYAEVTTVAPPDPFNKVSPANGATDVSTAPTLDWEDSTDVENYYYCLDTTNNTVCDTSWTVVGKNSYVDLTGLDPETTYYWQVLAYNSIGSAYGNGDMTVYWSFTTGAAPGILLVDDDDNNPSVRSYYTDALDALGLDYDVWETNNSNTEPDAATLAGYEKVIWFTGDAYTNNYTGPGAAGEIALGTYLDNGGCFLISSQDWYYDVGLTPFMVDYLGIDSIVNDVLNTEVEGVSPAYYLLGPYTLSYPIYNYSDSLDISYLGHIGFTGDVDDYAGATYSNGIFKTSYLVFPVEAVADVADRADVLGGFINYCDASAPGAFNKSSPANGAIGQPVSLTLSWNASSGVNHYHYCYDTTDDGECTDWTYNGSSTSVSISGLSLGATYYWHVVSHGNGGNIFSNGSETAFFSFTTGGDPPAAFAKLFPANAAVGQNENVTLEWEGSLGADSYEYCIDNVVNSSCDTAYVSVGGDTFVNLSGLTMNAIYTWQVRAKNSAGYTSAGVWWWFRTGTVPGAFSKIAPANAATGQIINPTLSWGTSTGATSYEYCIDTSVDSACSTSWVPVGNVTSTILSGLSTNTTYNWQVRSKNINGYTNSGVWWWFKTGTYPGAFTKTAPANAATGQLLNPMLSWGVSTSATSYEYCIDTSVDSACGTSWIDVGNVTSKMLSGLTQNTIYTWQVRAKNGIGYTGSGAWFWFRTGTLPGAFTKTSPANAATGQSTSPTLLWGASTGATSYEYCIDTSVDSACSTSWVSTGAATSVALSGLDPNTTYTWQVRAKNALGLTNSGAWWWFKTGVTGAIEEGGPVGEVTTENKTIESGQQLREMNKPE